MQTEEEVQRVLESFKVLDIGVDAKDIEAKDSKSMAKLRRLSGTEIRLEVFAMTSGLLKRDKKRVLFLSREQIKLLNEKNQPKWQYNSSQVKKVEMDPSCGKNFIVHVD